MENHESESVMIISFTGHSHIYERDIVKELVKEQIRRYIMDAKHIACYLGGYGDFDEICALACRELKREYEGIEVVYVTAYLGLSEQAKIQEMQSRGLYDASIYPPIEKTPLRFAIAKRNEWMMANADLVIAYVDHAYGGAYRSLQAAKRRKKKIINICELLKGE